MLCILQGDGACLYSDSTTEESKKKPQEMAEVPETSMFNTLKIYQVVRMTMATSIITLDYLFTFYQINNLNLVINFLKFILSRLTCIFPSIFSVTLVVTSDTTAPLKLDNVRIR